MAETDSPSLADLFKAATAVPVTAERLERYRIETAAANGRLSNPLITVETIRAALRAVREGADG